MTLIIFMGATITFLLYIVTTDKGRDKQKQIKKASHMN